MANMKSFLLRTFFTVTLSYVHGSELKYSAEISSNAQILSQSNQNVLSQISSLQMGNVNLDPVTFGLIDSTTGKPFNQFDGKFVGGSTVSSSFVAPLPISNQFLLPMLSNFIAYDLVTRLPIDLPTQSLMDPSSEMLLTGLIPGVFANVCSPIVDVNISDEVTFDPDIKCNFETKNGELVPPGFSSPIVSSRSCGFFGSYIVDPVTGFNLDENSGLPIDPYSNAPFDPLSGFLVNRLNGNLLSGTFPGVYHMDNTVTYEMFKQLLFDPKINAPCNAENTFAVGMIFDVSSNEFIPYTTCKGVEKSEVPVAPVKPAVVKPAVTKPAVVKPAVTKPAVVKPADTKPAVTKPSDVEPSATKPSATKPAVTKPSEEEPSATKPAVTKPSDEKPSATKPAVTKPSDEKPSATKPTVTKPSDEEPSATKPAVTKPSDEEPSTTKPTVTKPSDEEPSATKPVATKPVATKPVATKPAVTKPAVTKPVATKPAVTKPAVTKPAVTKPAVTKPAVTKPAVTKPAVTKPNPNKIKPVPQLDPYTGLPFNPTTGQISNKGSDISGSQAGIVSNVKKVYPTQTHHPSGLPIDPKTGLPFSTSTGKILDPYGNTFLNGTSPAHTSAVDGKIKTDGKTGIPINPLVGKPIDPVSGIPFDSSSGTLCDPTTGNKIDNSTAGIISGISGSTKLKPGSNGKMIDPATNLPISSDGNQLLNPSTGKIIPGSRGPSKQQTIATEAPGNGGIIPSTVANANANKYNANQNSGTAFVPSSLQIFDSISKLYYNRNTGRLVDPLLKVDIPGSIAGILNPNISTTIQLTNIRGLPLDPSTGLPFVPTTGNLVNPMTNATIPLSSSGAKRFSSYNSIHTESTFGLPVDLGTGLPIDPISQLPFNKTSTMLVDPVSNKEIKGSIAGILSGKSGLSSSGSDSSGRSIDPSTNMPFDPDTGYLINPVTNKVMVGTVSGTMLPAQLIRQATGGYISSNVSQEQANIQNTVGIEFSGLNIRIDPVTGLNYVNTTGKLIDPRIASPIPGSFSPFLGYPNTTTPLQTDKITKFPVDTMTGLPFNPVTCELFNPMVKKVIPRSFAPSCRLVEMRGIKTDATTGLPIDNVTGLPVDPVTKLPIATNGTLFDPLTKVSMLGSRSGFLSGISGIKSNSTDKKLKLPIDPSSLLPFISSSSQLVDPLTGKEIPNSRSGTVVNKPLINVNNGGVFPPSNAKIDIFSSYNLYPQPQPESDYLSDSISNTWWNKNSGHIFDPKIGRVVYGSSSCLINIVKTTPTQTDKVTGFPIDPSSGMPFMPGFGRIINPQTRESIIGSRACVTKYVFSQGIKTDPIFGLELDPVTSQPIDPISRLPFNVTSKNLLDPTNGYKEIINSTAGILSGLSGSKSVKKSPLGPIDPSTNCPYNITTGNLINPMTKKQIKNSATGVYYPAPGTNAPGPGGIIPSDIASSNAKSYSIKMEKLKSGDTTDKSAPQTGNIAIQAAGGASAGLALVGSALGAWYARRRRRAADDDEDYEEGYEAEYDDEDEEEEEPRESVVTIDRESSFWNES